MVPATLKLHDKNNTVGPAYFSLMVRCYGLCETYFEYGFSPQEGHLTVLLGGWKYFLPPPTHKHKLKEIKEQFSGNNDLAISYEIVLKLKKNFLHLWFQDVSLKKKNWKFNGSRFWETFQQENKRKKSDSIQNLIWEWKSPLQHHHPKKFQPKFVTIVMEFLPKNAKLCWQNAGYGIHGVKDTILISQVL